MKDKIENSPQYGLKALEDKLSNKNKKLLIQAETIYNATAGKHKRQEHRRTWIKIAYTMEKNMDKLIPNDGLIFSQVLNDSEISECTKNIIRKDFRRWIKESGFYNDWNVKWMNVFKALKLQNDVNPENTSSDTLMEKPFETINELVQGTPNVMFKALLKTTGNSAGRPGCEVLPLKFKDVNYDKHTIKINSGKTGRQRTIYVEDATDLIKRWYDEYSFPNPTKEDYIFPGIKREKPMALPTFERMLAKLSKKVIGKVITPYCIRHSVLKVMQKKLSPLIYEDYSDHSLAVASKFYKRNDENDIANELKKNVYKISELPKEKKHKLELENEQMKLQLKLFANKLLGKITEEDFKNELGNLLSKEKEIVKIL